MATDSASAVVTTTSSCDASDGPAEGAPAAGVGTWMSVFRAASDAVLDLPPLEVNTCKMQLIAFSRLLRCKVRLGTPCRWLRTWIVPDAEDVHRVAPAIPTGLQLSESFGLRIAPCPLLLLQMLGDLSLSFSQLLARLGSLLCVKPAECMHQCQVEWTATIQRC